MKSIIGTICRCTAILLLVVCTGSAETVNFNNNCEGQIPTNQGYKWFGSCPDPVYDETNWVGNIFPGPGDIAVIGVEYGPIEVNSYSYNPEVQRVQAPGGLILNHSSWDLTVTDGISNITGLQLSGNADFTAAGGAIVYLEGSSQLGADLRGPGIISSSGTLNLNYCRLWDAGILQNEGTANLSSSSMSLNSGNTTFYNGNIFNISGSAGDISGPTCRFVNDGEMSCSRAGAIFYFDPKYEQRGDLSVLAGTLYMRSVVTDFESGSVSIAASGKLQLGNTPFGGDQSYEFSGLSEINGSGLLDIYSDYSVTADISLNVGSGDPAGGTGGTLLRGDLTMEGAGLTNTGRLRFMGGKIIGNSGETFTNSGGGWVYTRNQFGGTLNCIVTNNANFEVNGPSLTIDSVYFRNNGSFKIVLGLVSGSGFLANYGTVAMHATNQDNISSVNCDFYCGQGGTVEASTGHLRFTGLVLNIEDQGELFGGDWKAQSQGKMTFPETITDLYGARVTGSQSSFPNVDPSVITDGVVESDSWGFGDLLLEDSTLKAKTSNKGNRDGITVEDTLRIGEGSLVILETGTQLTAGHITNGIETPGETPAEIAGEGNPGTLATVITPLLDNRGRIVPGGHDNTGTLYLQGDLVQLDGGEVMIDLNGQVAGTEYDQLTIAGDAELAGTVTVTTLPDLTPEVGQQFVVLTATGSMTGAFAEVTSTDNVSYSLIHEVDSVILVVESVGGVAVPSADLPKNLELLAPFPNPFNPSTEIHFGLGQPEEVEIGVFCPNGRRVRTLARESFPAGWHAIRWDGRDATGKTVAAGVYFVRLRTEKTMESRKIMLVK